MSAQLIVGPHSKSSLIRSDSTFTTGHINLNNGISVISGDIEVNDNIIIYNGGITASNLILTDVTNQTLIIGDPTFNSNEVFPGLGATHYPENINLGISSGTIISDAIQKTGNWLETYLIDQPNKLTLGSTSNDSEKLSITWTYPDSLKSAFLEDINFPHIENIKIDYVKTSLNGDDSFSDVSTVNLTINDNSVNEIQVFVDGATGYLDGTIWKEEQSIEPGIDYDFRIYPSNFSDLNVKEYNYLIVKNVSTDEIEAPDPVTGVTYTNDEIEDFSISITWTEPLDHNTGAIGNQSFPFIEYYGITYTALSSVSTNGLITHTGVTTTDIAVNENSETYKTLFNLNPGTTYQFDIFAKNSISDSFSTNVTINNMISIPDNPGITYDLTFPNEIVSPFDGGYDLSGTTLYESIVNYNNLDSNELKFTTQGPNDTFLEPGETSTNVSNITLYGGIVSGITSVSQQIDGFGNPSISGEFNSSGSEITLGITNHLDYYINDSVNKQGFWKSIEVYGIGTTSSFIPSSSNEYLFKVEHEVTGVTTIESNELRFAIDDINVYTGVTNVGIYDILNGDITYVSGIPTFNSDTIFKYRFNIDNLAKYYLRNDKLHFESGLNVGITSNTYGLDDIDGITHFYYEEEPGNEFAISSTLHNTNGLTLGITDTRNTIQFNTFTIDVGTTENIYTEDLTLSITGYNLYGITNAITGNFLGTTGIEQDIRMDLNSINLLLDIVDETDTYGRLVTSGTTQYPSDYETDYGITYDHSKSLTTEYTEDLQIVNGKFYGVNNSFTFLDYTNYWFPYNLSPNLLDYSSATIDSNYRYSTFKYTRSFSGSYNKVRLIINDTNISDYTSYRLYLRVVDTRTLSIGEYSYATSWMNCNKSIGWNGVHNTANDDGCLDTINTTSETDRICYIKLTDEDAIFFVKFGIPNDSDLYFDKISLEIYS